MKRTRPSSLPEPIQVFPVTPAKEEDEPRNRKQLQLVVSSASRFGLPDGWSVEERPRPSSATVDKYYIEPNTGLKFRSLAAAHRYLNDGKIDTRVRRGPECKMQSYQRSSSFILPVGWEIEEKPRNNCRGHVDKYYIEPRTGKRFRSLISVEKYLAQGVDETTPLQALISANNSSLQSGFDSEPTKFHSLEPGSKHLPYSNESNRTLYLPTPPRPTHSTHSNNFSSSKTNISRESDRRSVFNIGSPPTKVNWVLGGPGGNMWNAFTDDTKVSDSVKQKWFEIFKSSICEENIKSPGF